MLDTIMAQSEVIDQMLDERKAHDAIVDNMIDNMRAVNEAAVLAFKWQPVEPTDGSERTAESDTHDAPEKSNQPDDSHHDLNTAKEVDHQSKQHKTEVKEEWGHDIDTEDVDCPNNKEEHPIDGSDSSNECAKDSDSIDSSSTSTNSST